MLHPICLAIGTVHKHGYVTPSRLSFACVHMFSYAHARSPSFSLRSASAQSRQTCQTLNPSLNTFLKDGSDTYGPRTLFFHHLHLDRPTPPFRGKLVTPVHTTISGRYACSISTLRTGMIPANTMTRTLACISRHQLSLPMHPMFVAWRYNGFRGTRCVARGRMGCHTFRAAREVPPRLDRVGCV
ncbi:hypothetical protein CC80DRAFT_280206 [Byssothecium circinans]|uniref:Uncharacterized protein n=1 Tax=Byssothecium circinans TaxID=147558 RepID=A0A6A5TBT9_9PLEO|nr:hypothetical protein CC80DRAFT_280206 [Byssothecium circinans]